MVATTETCKEKHESVRQTFRVPRRLQLPNTSGKQVTPETLVNEQQYELGQEGNPEETKLKLYEERQRELNLPDILVVVVQYRSVAGTVVREWSPLNKVVRETQLRPCKSNGKMATAT